MSRAKAGNPPLGQDCMPSVLCRIAQVARERPNAAQVLRRRCLIFGQDGRLPAGGSRLLIRGAQIAGQCQPRKQHAQRGEEEGGADIAEKSHQRIDDNIRKEAESAMDIGPGTIKR